jgi:hypothetical protein
MVKFTWMIEWMIDEVCKEHLEVVDYTPTSCLNRRPFSARQDCLTVKTNFRLLSSLRTLNSRKVPDDPSCISPALADDS